MAYRIVNERGWGYCEKCDTPARQCNWLGDDAWMMYCSSTCENNGTFYWNSKLYFHWKKYGGIKR